MTTSEDLNDAWRQGYTKGWQSLKPTLPSIPTRAASYPAGILDPWDHFYQEGYRLGRLNASMAPP